MKKVFLFALALCTLTAAKANDPQPDSSDVRSEALMQAMYEAWADSINASLHYDTGIVDIKNGLATLHVPAGFKYLNPKDADMVLTDLWGNPPSDPGYGSLGMLFPEEASPLDENMYAIDITYSEEGYIDDSDAKDIDYDELLETMQADAEAASVERQRLGYESVRIVGWASPPYYDEVNKKLHWAQEIQFGDAESNTLNYNIRVLGRGGYLNLNVIGDMDVLPRVKSDINAILPAIEFNEGHRYVDFDSSIDKVAAYGIGGLIAGKVLAKAGILAKLGILLAKFWKILAVGAVSLFAGIRRFLRGEPAEESPQQDA
ncbi:MAG: DUF2167 domain-containing protein [Bacteroidetes bacterium]|nr:MAG: DUF2167 domain-containing protein [Bacteroidota bacterium]